MRTAAAAFVVIGIVASPLVAQERGRYGQRAQGIPPGHLPPPGECRVWYDTRPPGQQPPPTSCRDAERVASRDRYARVIYGGDRDRRDKGWRDRSDDRRERGRAVPRERYPYPERYPDSDRSPYPERRDRYPDRDPSDRGGYGYDTVPFNNGYEDGYEQGREDARDNDAYDPVRHGRYRSGDRGYDRRYGSKEQYADVYRQGFRAGYDEGYRDAGGDGRDPRSTRSRFPWPF